MFMLIQSVTDGSCYNNQYQMAHDMAISIRWFMLIQSVSDGSCKYNQYQISDVNINSIRCQI